MSTSPLSQADKNIAKLAAHLAAGMNEGFVSAHSRGRFDPTVEELARAAELAYQEFRAKKYCLRSQPNGTMTDLDVARTLNTTTTDCAEEERLPK